MTDLEYEIYVANCQKILHMIGELYSRGFKAIQPIPNFREGTGRWWLSLCSDKCNVIAVEQWFAELGKPDMRYEEYEKTPYRLTAKELADQFMKDHPEWLEKTKLNSVDEVFVAWYQALLTTLKEGDLPFVENMDAESNWFIGNSDASARTRMYPRAIASDFSSLGLPLLLRAKIVINLISGKYLKKTVFRI